MRKAIEKLAKLDAHVWHSVTMQMAWHFRTGGARDVPAVVLAIYGGTSPSRETWAQLRRRVNARRKAMQAEERRYLQRQRDEHRRTYMRKYMRDYRKQARV